MVSWLRTSRTDNIRGANAMSEEMARRRRQYASDEMPLLHGIVVAVRLSLSSICHAVTSVWYLVSQAMIVIATEPRTPCHSVPHVLRPDGRVTAMAKWLTPVVSPRHDVSELFGIVIHVTTTHVTTAITR